MVHMLSENKAAAEAERIIFKHFIPKYIEGVEKDNLKATLSTTFLEEHGECVSFCYLILFQYDIIILLLILLQMSLLIMQLQILITIVSRLPLVNRSILPISGTSVTPSTPKFLGRLLVGFVLRFIGLLMLSIVERRTCWVSGKRFKPSRLRCSQL